jgi:AbiJ N-terminal domain 4
LPKIPVDDPYAERRKLTFEQAEGAEPLPAQLKLKELSPLLRSALWNVILPNVESGSYHVDYNGFFVHGSWAAILRDWHVYRLHKPVDEFNAKLDNVTAELKSLIMGGDYLKVFGFLQFAIRHQSSPYQFDKAIERALRIGHAAYTLSEKTIVPVGSEAELATIKRAIADLASTEFHGARKHLQNAAEHLTGGKLPDSIREEHPCSRIGRYRSRTQRRFQKSSS